MSAALEAVLFDLDGTLLDTAPDMVAALNTLLLERGREPVPFERARMQVSNGALGLLRLGFPELGEAQLEALRNRYLEIYARGLDRGTRLFPGLAEVLAALEARGLPWGIVTNKPAALTEPLLRSLNLAARCACVVSGDSLARRKPHPDPLLHAAASLGIPPSGAVYLGDAPRDIRAGRAAGMRTAAVAWGYLEAGEDPARWGADHLLSHPEEIMTLVFSGRTGR
ncbi:MAG: phosphoglycolate phosphatase [Gammaproteobacteria bacterium]|nr:MAG: phosphoglycolate phosphatase [Gammaproteobacteria bacterium]